MSEFVRSDPSAAGIRRRRCGRGFLYVRPGGGPVRDAATIARIRSLVIPPAWKDVWICTDPAGHIQAVGTDAAGRRQYRYHDVWRKRRDEEKHDRMLEFGAALPLLREVIRRHLGERGLVRERVLAAAVQLIDLGFFRPGGEDYAAENGSFGLATIRRDHVAVSRGQIVFTYPGKSAKHQEQAVAEDQVCAVVRSLKGRRGAGDRLLAYRSGRCWHDVTATDINDYLREVSGREFTAKDFRTWHGTVLAAVGLAVSEGAATAAARRRAIARVCQEVASYLGNTPAVARASYIDPRVISLYEEGRTIAASLGGLGKETAFGDLATAGHAEQAVLKLLAVAQPSRSRGNTGPA